MSKPQIIIPVIIQFSIRYVLRTGFLDLLQEYAEPVILLAWEDAEIKREFEAAGAEVHQLPGSDFSRKYLRLKRQIDHCHLQRIASPSTAIDKRRIHQVAPQSLRVDLRNQLYDLLALAPGRMERLVGLHAAALESETSIQQFEQLLKNLNADAVFSLTPYLQPEQLLLMAAQRLGLGLSSAILSFDNITTRGWIPVTFDAYFLWNNYNRSELLRGYPEVTKNSITIVGAPQFDFYWDKSYLWPEAQWRQALGLPDERPVILFGAGHYLIVPHEPHWLIQLDEAISAGDIPGQPVILFRRHPNDPAERWQSALSSARQVIVDDPWAAGQNAIPHTNITRYDIEKLTSTLAYSHVHINASSTLTIDGAIFDRPQIGPAYDDSPGRPYDRITHDLYIREHYLPITHSGGLTVVEDRAALLSAVRQGLEQPEAQREARRQMVREIVTYDDGQATARLNAALRRFLQGETQPLVENSR